MNYYPHQLNQTITLKEWVEVKTDNGSIFYYNKKLNSSTWEKPNELKTEEEKLSGWNKQIGVNGQVYYFNPILNSSVWDEPEELKLAKEQIEIIKQNNLKQAEINKNISKQVEYNKSMKIQQNTINYDKLSKQEINTLFKDLLKKTNITSTWTWEDTERVLNNEDCWQAVKTFQERKQLFNDYIRDCKIREREEIRAKKDKLKHNFIQMLEEDSSITSDSNYIDYYQKFYNDDRWRSLDEKEREEQFENYLDELEKRENEEREIILNTKMKIFKDLLYNENLSYTTKWKDFVKKFPFDDDATSIEKYEKIKEFSDYIEKLFKIEDNLKLKEQEEKEFCNRELFRDMLVEDVDNEIVNCKTKWNEYVKLLYNRHKNNDHRYWSILGQEGLEAKELFYDVSYILRNEYKLLKEKVKNYLKTNNYKITKQTTFEEFNELLNNSVELSSIKKTLKNALYSHTINKYKDNDNAYYKDNTTALKKLKSFIFKKYNNDIKKYSINEVLSTIEETGKFIILTNDEIVEVINQIRINDNRPKDRKEEGEI